jgi:protein-disulfide isomerase
VRARLGLSAAALTLFLGGCGGEDEGNPNAAAANVAAPLTQIAAPDDGDWTQIVTETPEGGYRMGNPDAPVKLVEYASITCHVCAEFSDAGSRPLQERYVRSGQLSWEYRPFMLFPSDPAVFALLRCQGATPFFRLAEQLYATQAEWAGRLQTLSPERAQQLQSMAPGAQAAAIVEVTQLGQFFRQRGMPEARINSCLADASGYERLAEITRTGGEQHDVRGTPTFLINGERQDVTAWPELEQRLRAAAGS